MFGASFVLVDGYHLELEDEFAFSICEDYDEMAVDSRRMDLCRGHSSEDDDDVTMSSESDDDEDTKVEESNEWSFSQEFIGIVPATQRTNCFATRAIQSLTELIRTFCHSIQLNHKSRFEN